MLESSSLPVTGSAIKMMPPNANSQVMTVLPKNSVPKNDWSIKFSLFRFRKSLYKTKEAAEMAEAAEAPASSSQDLACFVRGSLDEATSRPSPLGQVTFTVDGQEALLCYGRPAARVGQACRETGVNTPRWPAPGHKLLAR